MKKKVRCNSIPIDKILGWSKFKAHADDKINVTQDLDFVSRRVEHILTTLKVPIAAK